MGTTQQAQRLRRDHTAEEKQLWRALKAGRFAGFKFRRQHPVGSFFLDFYCPTARLSIELDGFHHGIPEQQKQDALRRQFLEEKGIAELRFWNSQWRKNQDGILLEIWNALHQRSGCVSVKRKVENHRYVPPDPDELKR